MTRNITQILSERIKQTWLEPLSGNEHSWYLGSHCHTLALQSRVPAFRLPTREAFHPFLTLRSCLDIVQKSDI